MKERAVSVSSPAASPLMSTSLILLFLFLFLATDSTCSRVYELSDKFLELYQKDSRPWLVKFYAPWCYHCKQLEPVYVQVAQQLAADGSHVVVGRVDCTRWTAVSNAFPIRGFPTILFISGDSVVEYDGERAKDEIADFATRLSSPVINTIMNCDSLDEILEKYKIFFLHVGPTIPNYYRQAASKYRSTNWFYHVNGSSCPSLAEGSYVVKGPVENRVTDRYNEDLWNSSMSLWIRRERFALFVKVTPSLLNRVVRSGKFVVQRCFANQSKLFCNRQNSDHGSSGRVPQRAEAGVGER